MDEVALMEGARPAIRSAQEAEELVVGTIQRHADALLKLARRYSLCADDAHDAYQRGLEIFLRHASGLDADRAHSWLFTVVKREAWEVRRQRQQLTAVETVDFDLLEARDTASPEDYAIDFEDVAQSAEALRQLKPHEIRALWLRASGKSYSEIADACGWSYTKVNRCIAEGRANLRRRLASIQDGTECDRWFPTLSAMIDGEATAEDMARARPHLRNCPGCRAHVRQMHDASRSLALIFPVALAVEPGAGGPDPAGVLARIYEAASSFLHERAAVSAIKVQAALDVATTGKVAAVAASAAAIAGGGAMVADGVVKRAERPTAHVARHHGPGTAAPWPTPAATSLAGHASTVRAAVRADRAGARRSLHAVRRTVHPSRPAHEFGAEGALASPASSPQRSSTPTANAAGPSTPTSRSVVTASAPSARSSSAAVREFAP